jgi:hypothetical protein
MRAIEFILENAAKNVVYHGTRSQFTNFKNATLGTSTGDPNAVLGHFFTSSMEEARLYGNYVISATLQLNNPYETDMDELVGLPEEEDYIELRDELMSQGYDGLIAPHDEGDGYWYVVFSPNQIKIVDAETITERRKNRKSKRAYGRYFYPGYAYYGLGGSDSSGDAGGDGGGGESIYESPEVELASRLPSLAKHDYNTIDDLMRKVAKKHKITSKALHDLFQKKYHKTPDRYIKNKLDEVEVSRAEMQQGNAIEKAMAMDPTFTAAYQDFWSDTDDSFLGSLEEDDHVKCDLENEVEKFVDWTAKKLNLKKVPSIELSMDTEEAQGNHHTGGHTPGSGVIWVYSKNRNLVDILRTVFHELVHVRQEELNMIKPNSSYPGSPIEAMADMLAGKYIKIYGEKNHHIFQ